MTWQMQNENEPRKPEFTLQFLMTSMKNYLDKKHQKANQAIAQKGYGKGEGRSQSAAPVLTRNQQRAQNRAQAQSQGANQQNNNQQNNSAAPAFQGGWKTLLVIQHQRTSMSKHII